MVYRLLLETTGSVMWSPLLVYSVSVRQKHKKTSHTKYFKKPFRVDQYKQHLEGQHETRWKEYQALSNKSKKTYFDVVPLKSTISSHFPGASDQLIFVIDAPIVDVVLQHLLFDPDVDEHVSDSVMKIFEPLYNAENKDVVTEYCLIIKNMRLFNIVVGMVALGSSFHLAMQQVTCIREELQLGHLGGCDEQKVSTFICVVAGACLQSISSALNKVWAFAVAFDSTTVESTSYFDVCVRFVQGTKLHGFHLFCLPIHGSHTGEMMFNGFDEAISVICPSWSMQILSTCSDGARNMTGCVRGIVSRIASQVLDTNGLSLI